MSAARRGAVAATVLLLGFVALLLSPAATRAGSPDPAPTQSLVPQASPSPSAPPTCRPLITPCPLPITSITSSSKSSSTTGDPTTPASPLTSAVLPGNVTSIPPTATPRPAPTPRLTPAATTDTGITALGTDTASATSEFTRASTVINPQPGGDSSSVLPLTVLAFLVIIGGGAIFLITRLR